MEKAGVCVEDREYSNDDLQKVEREITEYIMSHSSKDGSIGKLQNEYQSIFRTIDIK